MNSTAAACPADEIPSNDKVRANDEYIREILQFDSVLRATIYRFVNNSSDVEELLQETYARLLAVNISSKSNIRSLRAFCLTVARNITLDWLRHRQIVPIDLIPDMEVLELLDEGAMIDEIVNTDQELEQVATVVNRLPARCREVFTLRRVYGHSQKEIAMKLQISENTVEQHLTKAMRQCTQFLLESKQAHDNNGMFARLRNRRKA